MLSRYFGPRIHTQIQVFLLCALAVGLVLSKFVMSLSMMLLVLNVLLEADFKSYWQNLRSSRLFHWVALLFLIHAISLLWSSNLGYGIHDLKVKLPLLVTPMVLAAKPVTNRTNIKWILQLFVAAVLFATLYNYIAYQQVFGPRDYDDIRGMSLFDSHVRLSLMVVMAIVATVQLYRWRIVPVFLMMGIVVWLHYYTYYSQVISGAMALVGIYTIYGFYWLHRRYKILAYSAFSVFMVVTISVIVWIFTPITYDAERYSPDRLSSERTAEGRKYTHNPSEVCPETGKPIDIYICHPELRREWNKVSNIPYDDGRDRKGQLIFRTLTRYMASKDLRKDAAGFKQLDAKDIRAIERGHTSFHYKGIWSRISGLRYQISNVSNPNGHSLLQRLEYWRTGTEIALDNWIIGTGSGDVQDAFNQKYVENNSQLTKENRDRAHNMFLTIFLSFGILGLLVFLAAHLDFLRIQFNAGQLVGLGFIAIILVSYLVEDTLETQSGVTFFGLFYGLFLFDPKKRSKS